MTSITQQFKWQDRDTAARDILQIVYHAPPYLAQLDSRLLRAFHSAIILPELRALILDSTREPWLRVNALRAYNAVRGKVSVENFDLLIRTAILHREQRFQQVGERGRAIDPLTPDLLDDFAQLADAHPNH